MSTSMADDQEEPSIEFDIPEELKGESPSSPTSGATNMPRVLDDIRSLSLANTLEKLSQPSASQMLYREVERMEQMHRALGGVDHLSAISKAQELSSALGKYKLTDLAATLGVGVIKDVVTAQHLASFGISGMHRLADVVMLGHFAREAASVTELHRSLMGPLGDLRSSGVLMQLDEMSEYRKLGLGLTAYERLFSLPSAAQITDLVRQTGGLDPGLEYVEVAKRLHAPWLDTMDAARSIIGFAGLHDIGLTLRVSAPYAHDAAAQLRGLLGDFRDPIAWPQEIENSLITRSAFYIDHGHHAELTDFPPEAFTENLDVAGFGDGQYEISEEDYSGWISGAPEERSAFDRTNRAHMLLMVFEVRLRVFIDTRLTQAFGMDWPRHQLPNGMYDRWLDKKEKAEKRGLPARPPVDYADFTDYSQILTKKNLWPIFQLAFTTEESVRESFNRLHMPRIEAMHGRPLSQDDELFLRVEVKRIRSAMN
jgi:hypothetical protein